jgi:hypothetical protein
MQKSKVIAIASFAALVINSKLPATLTTASASAALAIIFGCALIPIVREYLESAFEDVLG